MAKAAKSSRTRTTKARSAKSTTPTDVNYEKYSKEKPPFLTTTEAMAAAVAVDDDAEAVEAPTHDEAVEESGIYPSQGVVEWKTVVKEFPDTAVIQEPFLTQAQANAAATGEDAPDDDEAIEASGITLPLADGEIGKGMVHPVGKVYDQEQEGPFLTTTEANAAALNLDVDIPREVSLREAGLAAPLVDNPNGHAETRLEETPQLERAPQRELASRTK